MATKKKKQTTGTVKKAATKTKAAPTKKTKSNQAVKQQTTQFPIVGIGASAGGLEAFGEFFSAMPEKSGIAFVLVAHLSPSHASILPELIQKKTKMKVCQVTDNMQVLPNQVYIIPPNKEMAILNGTLQLLEFSQPRGMNLPIDTFMRSLAQDMGQRAIGIILSGTGTDGTLGVRAIKGDTGMVMCQDLDSAKYDGMPRSAIGTGLVDFTLAPEKMPQKLLRYVQSQNKDGDKNSSEKDSDFQSCLKKIFVLLRAATKHDFSLYKVNTICRRIERRMHVHQIDKIEDYVRYLQESDQEITILFKELLIGVTSFFRDKEAFKLLKDKYIPQLLENKHDDYPVRIWVPGCSSGEEAYSIAMSFQECMETMGCNYTVQIFGTDLDQEAINLARAGLYPESISADVSNKYLKKYFTKEENYYLIKKNIREMVVFAPQNIIKDPPFTKLDMLCCRNLLIYFGPELQKKLLPIFHYSLKQDGILFLGSSETIGHTTDLFLHLEKKWKIFKRYPSQRAIHSVLDFPSSVTTMVSLPEKEIPESLKPVKDMNTSKLLKAILSHSDMPASVVIDDRANLIYTHGRTGRFLEVAEGETSINILEMARPGLKAGLTNAIRKMASDRIEIMVKGLQVKSNGGYVDLNLIVKPLPDFQTGHRGMMLVSFEEIAYSSDKKSVQISKSARTKKSDDLKRLEEELQYTKENLQTTIEELETSNEELKSTNEELQSTNEELQSTNEELETSKEELQSLNEESSTVNSELSSRIEELVEANDDIRNLLDATDIATIFLDIDFNIRRFTPRVTDYFHLTIADNGRPIEHFSTTLQNVNLVSYAKKVLKDLAVQDVEVVDTQGKIIRMRVRPYRTINNVIDGVVGTFEDITKMKTIETELAKIADGFEQKSLMMTKVFMDSADPIIIEDLDGKILEVNNETIESYGWSREDLIGKSGAVLTPPEGHAQVDELLIKCRKDNEPVRNIEGFRLHKSGKIVPVLLTFSLLKDVAGKVSAIASIAKNYPPPPINK